ncbi:MAG: peptide deformylase [Pseudomonadota bacterium]
MAVKEILKMGHPVLQRVADPIMEFNTQELHSLVEDMLDTMQAADGAGLAAPQIGVSKRLVIFGGEQPARYPDADVVPYTVLLNPEIKPLTDDTSGFWEGCLSVPGMRGYVERPNQIHYTGFDLFGNKIDRQVEGFHAIVVQHECDHLDGVLYPQRLSDPNKFGFIEALSFD